MSEKEQQFERIYKETENFGRTQFVREIQMQINDNKKKDKEIERLNKELKSLQDSYDIEEEQANYHIDLTDDLREEVDRLNNIINELEDYMIGKDIYKILLYKLRDLKESDKE